MYFQEKNLDSSLDFQLISLILYHAISFHVLALLYFVTLYNIYYNFIPLK